MPWTLASKWRTWSQASSASSATPPTRSDGQREPGVEDATRRTRLANERTYLAWWRTGLTAMALGVGVGRLLPATTDSASHWAEQALGAAFGVLGIVLLWIGFSRTRAVEDALDRGAFAPLDLRLPTVLLAAGVLLGLGVVALVVFG